MVCASGDDGFRLLVFETDGTYVGGTFNQPFPQREGVALVRESLSSAGYCDPTKWNGSFSSVAFIVETPSGERLPATTPVQSTTSFIDVTTSPSDTSSFSAALHHASAVGFRPSTDDLYWVDKGSADGAYSVRTASGGEVAQLSVPVCGSCIGVPDVDIAFDADGSPGITDGQRATFANGRSENDRSKIAQLIPGPTLAPLDKLPPSATFFVEAGIRFSGDSQAEALIVSPNDGSRTEQLWMADAPNAEPHKLSNLDKTSETERFTLLFAGPLRSYPR